MVEKGRIPDEILAGTMLEMNFLWSVVSNLVLGMA